MKTCRFLKSHSIEDAQKILDCMPLPKRVVNGAEVEYQPTHYNCHPHAPIKWVFDDGAVVPRCVRDQNKPQFWIDLAELKRMIESLEIIENLEGVDKAQAVLDNKPDGANRYVRGYYLKKAGYVYEYNLHQKIWMQNGKHEEYSPKWQASVLLRRIKKAIADYKLIKE